MMKKGQVSLLLVAAFLLIFAAFAVQCTKVQKPDQKARTRIERTITGEIAKGYNDRYIIRSTKGTLEVFTVLNAEPKVLDQYIKSGKIVDIDVQVISGDNIEIMKIDGKEYPGE